MKYKIVQSVEGQLVVTEPNDVFAWAEVAGLKFVRLNKNPRQRAELQDQPVFAGLVGPTYDGPDCIRYEDREAYATLSA